MFVFLPSSYPPLRRTHALLFWQFDRPPYQAQAVAKYLDNLPHGIYEGKFNKYVLFFSMTAYPQLIHELLSCRPGRVTIPFTRAV